MNDENPVFTLFEGSCPTCGAEAKVTEVSGTQEFLNDFTFSGATTTLWHNHVPTSLTIGEVTFKCTNGHTHVVGHNSDGDWNL